MSASGFELLARLGSGVRPVETARTAAPAHETRNDAALGVGSFGALLQQARSGELSSGRAVELGPAAGLGLTDEQLERLADAADRALAAGSERAVVLMQGNALVLDVADRRIDQVTKVSELGTLTGIDTVLSAAAPTTTEATPAGLGVLQAAGALAHSTFISRDERAG